MANRRMISSDLWQDDFIGSLTFFERIVFMALITCVDDQGRMMNNPYIILAHAFTYDRNVKPEQVTSALEKIVTAGKVEAYEAGGKSLLQIVNWWKHQTPSWASPSLLPPPPGWIDRIKYHALGNEIKMENWDKPGGYIAALPGKQPKGLDSQLDSEIGSAREKVKSERREDPRAPDGAQAPPEILKIPEIKPKTQFVQDMEYLERVFAGASGCDLPDYEIPKAAKESQVLWRTPLGQIYNKCDKDLNHAADIVRAAIDRMIAGDLTFDSPKSILKTAMSELASQRRTGVRPGTELSAHEQLVQAARKAGIDVEH